MIGHPNLKLWLPLNSDALDLSGSSNNGTTTDVSYSAGITGVCGSFNGTSSKIVLANKLDCLLSGELTICAWIKPSAGDNRIIVAQEDSASGNHEHLFRISSNKLQASIYEGGGTNLTGNTILTVNGTAWYHVAYTKNGANGILYLNGVVDGSSSTLKTSVNPTAGNYTTVGVLKYTSEVQFFSGLIDNVHVYNKVFSQPDIRRIMYGKHPLARS